MTTRIAFVSCCLLLAACQPQGARPGGVALVETEAETPEPWRSVATDADIDRLQRIDAAWEQALADARRAGAARQVTAEGALLDPGAGLPRAALTPGSYRCRVIKLGSPRRGRAFQAFNPFFCYVGVEGELMSITKQTGSERPGGYLWDMDTRRLVFLGSMALGTEEIPRAYGDDPERDMAGILERVGPFRWRLVVPWPRGETKLDVFELVPALQ
jgi:hypothetical protein